MPPKEKIFCYEYTHHDHIRTWHLRRRYDALEWSAGINLVRDQYKRDMVNIERQLPWKIAVRNIVVHHVSIHAAFHLARAYLPIVRIMDDLAYHTDIKLRRIIACCGKLPQS